MSARRVALALAALGLALPGWASAQGLGDTAAKERAARERARRQEATRKAEPPKVFTNDDLAAGRPPGQAGEGSAPADASSATAEGSSSAVVPSAEAGDEATLPSQRLRAELDAVSSARSRVATLEARVRELGAKLNPMSTEFIYGSSGSGSAGEEAEVRAELQQTEVALGAARQELARATEALEDASRRQSVPLPEQ
ncbi:MAG TPA: hypothetical protein VGB87_17305 [Vicinamibacteria bacterium]